MSKLQYKKGLLYTSIELKYGKRSILIEDVNPNDRVNGLIGLDFLIGAKSIIDLVDLTIYMK